MTNSSFQPPTPEQTAWVFKQLLQHMNEGGTFRTLIYNKLGYAPKDYQTLYEDGFGLFEPPTTKVEGFERPLDDKTPLTCICA